MEPNLANGGDGSDGDFDYAEDDHSPGCVTYVYKTDYLPTTRRGIPLYQLPVDYMKDKMATDDELSRSDAKILT